MDIRGLEQIERRVREFDIGRGGDEAVVSTEALAHLFHSREALIAWRQANHMPGQQAFRVEPTPVGQQLDIEITTPDEAA